MKVIQKVRTVYLILSLGTFNLQYSKCSKFSSPFQSPIFKVLLKIAVLLAVWFPLIFTMDKYNTYLKIKQVVNGTLEMKQSQTITWEEVFPRICAWPCILCPLQQRHPILPGRILLLSFISRWYRSVKPSKIMSIFQLKLQIIKLS